MARPEGKTHSSAGSAATRAGETLGFHHPHDARRDYEACTDQLVYLSARLAADPRSISLAMEVDAILAEIDESQDLLRDARRAAARARALRDDRNDRGNRGIETLHLVPATDDRDPRGWEAQALEVIRARDVVRACRSNCAARLSVVLEELGALRDELD